MNNKLLLLETEKLLDSILSLNETNNCLNTEEQQKQALILKKKISVYHYRKNNPISRRLGMIIVFEEFLIYHNPNRSNYTYSRVLNNTTIRFNLSTRDNNKFNNLNEIHPEDPCTYFENRGRKLNGYKQALINILVAREWYIDKSKVSESLEEIKEDIQLCK